MLWKKENGFYAIDSIKLLFERSEPFVFPEHYEQAYSIQMQTTQDNYMLFKWIHMGGEFFKAHMA